MAVQAAHSVNVELSGVGVGLLGSAMLLHTACLSATAAHPALHVYTKSSAVLCRRCQGVTGQAITPAGLSFMLPCEGGKAVHLITLRPEREQFPGKVSILCLIS